MTRVTPFPVLTEAALKGSREIEAAMTLRITANASKEVLFGAIELVRDYIGEVMLRDDGMTGFQWGAAEVTKSAKRLIELAEAVQYAPSDPGAGQRLRDWFLVKYKPH